MLDNVVIIYRAPNRAQTLRSDKHVSFLFLTKIKYALFLLVEKRKRNIAVETTFLYIMIYCYFSKRLNVIQCFNIKINIGYIKADDIGDKVTHRQSRAERSVTANECATKLSFCVDDNLLRRDAKNEETSREERCQSNIRLF